jgi:hypothetical protein
VADERLPADAIAVSETGSSGSNAAEGLIRSSLKRRQAQIVENIAAASGAPLGWPRFHDARPGRRKIGTGWSPVRGDHWDNKQTENGAAIAVADPARSATGAQLTCPAPSSEIRCPSLDL